jgi:hypothetical protein
MAGPIRAREGLDGVERIELTDLIANWRSYRDQDVVVQGQLHCVDDTYCDLISTVGSRRTVFVNISHLAEAKRNRLLINCSEKNCYIGVFAWVGSWELHAIAVQEPDP